MKNDYEVRGDITAIIINSGKYGRLESLVSTDKLERLKGFPNTWNVRWDKNTESFYVQGYGTRENGKYKSVLLHRFLVNATHGMVVDHINHLTLDNTDSNLRVVTHAENKQNLKGSQNNSKSGIRGVYWHKGVNKWCAQIMVNRVNKHIGYFDNLEEAGQAAAEARLKYMPFSKESI